MNKRNYLKITPSVSVQSTLNTMVTCDQAFFFSGSAKVWQRESQRSGEGKKKNSKLKSVNLPLLKRNMHIMFVIIETYKTEK